MQHPSKFCEPRHLDIQEIESVHSVIERTSHPLEIHSPLSLIKHLARIKQNGMGMKVNQRHILNYGELTRPYRFSNVKHTEVKGSKYHQADLSSIERQLQPTGPTEAISIFKHCKSRESGSLAKASYSQAFSKKS